jgi:hypothetical protein
MAEWLRELALRSARQRSADPIELLLAEAWTLRYVLWNPLHATAHANAEARGVNGDLKDCPYPVSHRLGWM